MGLVLLIIIINRFFLPHTEQANIFSHVCFGAFTRNRILSGVITPLTSPLPMRITLQQDFVPNDLRIFFYNLTQPERQGS